MSQTITIHISDNAMAELRDRAARQQRTAEELAADVLETTIRPTSEDPVLRLLGTVTTDARNVSENHDAYLGQALLAELRDREP